MAGPPRPCSRARGARVFATDRDAASLDRTRAIIAGEGHECAMRVADARDTNQVKAAVDACVALGGGSTSW